MNIHKQFSKQILKLSALESHSSQTLKQIKLEMSSQLKTQIMTENQQLEMQIAELQKKLEIIKKLNAEMDKSASKSTATQNEIQKEKSKNIENVEFPETDKIAFEQNKSSIIDSLPHFDIVEIVDVIEMDETEKPVAKKSVSKKSEKSSSKSSDKPVEKKETFVLKVKSPCDCGPNPTLPTTIEMELTREELDIEIWNIFNHEFNKFMEKNKEPVKVSMKKLEKSNPSKSLEFDDIKNMLVHHMLSNTIFNELYEEKDTKYQLTKLINDNPQKKKLGVSNVEDAVEIAIEATKRLNKNKQLATFRESMNTRVPETIIVPETETTIVTAAETTIVTAAETTIIVTATETTIVPETVTASVDVKPKKAPKEKKEKASGDSKPKKAPKEKEVPMQKLKNIAKDLDIKGYTTMSRSQLEFVIKVPIISFNAKKLTKWFDSVKDDQKVYFFGSNGDVGFKIKGTNNVFFADRCNTKEKNFNENHHKRFFRGNDDVNEFDNEQLKHLKNTLEQCDVSFFMGSFFDHDHKEFSFISFHEIPSLSEIDDELLKTFEF